MTWKQVLEVLILATGIYYFLRFLQTTRGGGVLRGLVVMFLFAFVGLFLAGELLALEELRVILGGIIPYVAVIFTILFQPELRKAISRLGEQNRLVRFLGERRSGTVHEVVQAAVDMAGRRQGALIAFQRETPLEAYVQNAVLLDAEVRRLLIDGLFHPGSALHDGGVVIVGDRIAAAACIFPLTENPDLGKSVGTRHRAALGLTEETDAVVLVVSEETGAISIAHDGQLDRHISAERLEATLLERLGYDPEELEEGVHRPRVVVNPGTIARSLRDLLIEDPLRKLAALALGAVTIFTAHGYITERETLSLTVFESGDAREFPSRRQTLEIRLPAGDYVLVAPREMIAVVVEGTPGELDRIKSSLTGLLTLGEDVPTGGVELPLEDIVWTTEGLGDFDASIAWADAAPRLVVERYDELEVRLEPGLVRIDDSRLNRRLQVLEDRVRFSSERVKLRAPAPVIEELERGEAAPLFEPVVLRRDVKGEYAEPLELTDELAERDVSIVSGAQAILEIVPTRHTLSGLEKEIELIPDPEREGSSWTIQSFEELASFDILTAGLIPDDVEPGQQRFTEISGAIRRYVETKLAVVAREEDLRDQEGNTVPVVTFWPPADWRKDLTERLGTPIDEFAELEVVLKSEPRVRMVPPSTDDG